jgi:membrane-associated phospholipid phosphatase
VRSPSDPRLLPPGWSRVAASVVVLGALGAGGLGWWYAGGRTAGPLDTAVDDSLIAGGEPHEHLLWHLADLGSPPALVLGVAILVVAALRHQQYPRRMPAVLLAAAGPVLAAIVTEFLLKPVVDRTHYGGLSLPSGHATSITAQITVFLLVFVASGLPRRTWLRRGLVLLAGLVVVGVCGSMVSLERHYATDTVAGVLVGAAVVSLLALGLDSWARVRGFRSAEEGLPRHPDAGSP